MILLESHIHLKHFKGTNARVNLAFCFRLYWDSVSIPFCGLETPCPNIAWNKKLNLHEQLLKAFYQQYTEARYIVRQQFPSHPPRIQD